MKIKIFILLFLFLVPIVCAKEYHMSLLAVKELGNESYEGSSADLYLEVVSGEGHVFIETFPVTKVDTQLSTRFAKEVACSYLDVDCSVYDFKYRIKADSSIIGGPSAGASLAALTVAALKNVDVDQGVAVTGSINTGGIVGNVGALQSKIDSAKFMNVSRVLLPFGALSYDENDSVNLSDYAAGLNISVVEVSNLEDVVFEFTGKNFSRDYVLEVDPVYDDVMRMIAVDLCNRSDFLRENIDYVVDGNISRDAEKFSSMAREEFNEFDFYSSASYCYRANVKLKYLELLSKGYSSEDVVLLINAAQNQSDTFENELNFSKIRTINDLQAYMIVKERIAEANDYLSDSRSSVNDVNKSLSYLGLAIERLYSVNAWSYFFGTGYRDYFFDEGSVRDSCVVKLAEAQERIQYGRIYFPSILSDSESSFDDARSDFDSGDYVLCLFKASKAKAEVDAIISTVGMSKDGLPALVDAKLNAAGNNIARQSFKGHFPILSFSYYEYGDALRDSDPSAALLYSSYALEFSNLELYFSKNPSFRFPGDDLRTFFVFAFGFIVGAFVFYYYVSYSVRKVVKR